MCASNNREPSVGPSQSGDDSYRSASDFRTISRREVVLAGITGFISVLGFLFQTLFGRLVTRFYNRVLGSSETKIVGSKVFSPEYAEEGWIPGGITFVIENNGDQSVMIDRADIVIGDHVKLALCYTQGGYSSSQPCYSVRLPASPDLGKRFPVSLGEQVKKEGDSLIYSLTFSCEENEEVANVHLYLLDIKLIQSDGTAVNAGKFLLGTPKDRLLTTHWLPKNVRPTKGSKVLSQKEYLENYHGASQGVVNIVGQCYSSNNKDLLRIISKSAAVNAKMSNNMKLVRKVINSKEYNLQTDVVPPQDKHDVPKCE